MDSRVVSSYVVYPLHVEHERRKVNAERTLERMAGADYQLFELDNIVEENLQYLKENALLTTRGVRKFCDKLMAEKILKDIEEYL